MVYGRSLIRALGSLSLLADVTATRKATLMERWDIGHVANSSKGRLVSIENIRLRSHCRVGFTSGGKVLALPFRKLIVIR